MFKVYQKCTTSKKSTKMGILESFNTITLDSSPESRSATVTWLGNTTDVVDEV